MEPKPPLAGHESDQPIQNPYLQLEQPEPASRRETEAVMVETRKLTGILGRETKLFPDGYDIIPIGEEGFIIRNLSYPVTANGDWITFDLDDTLINYSAAKLARAEAYSAHLTKRGIEFSPNIQAGILAASDRFARWTELGRSSVTYHLTAHIQSSDWLTAQLAKVPEEQRIDTLAHMEEHLEQLKTGEAQESDPFYFRDGRLINRHRLATDRGMEEVFRHSIARGTPFDDTVDAMVNLSGLEPRPNLAVFTRGTPDFQLVKLIELIRSRDLPVSEFWLTKDQKGDFFHAVAKSGHTAFSGPDNAVVHLDDRATDVASILESRESGTIGSAMVDVVHLRRPDTTEAGRQILFGVRPENEAHLTHNTDTEDSGLLTEKLVGVLRDRLLTRLQSELSPSIHAAILARYEAYARYLEH